MFTLANESWNERLEPTRVANPLDPRNVDWPNEVRAINIAEEERCIQSNVDIAHRINRQELVIARVLEVNIVHEREYIVPFVFLKVDAVLWDTCRYPKPFSCRDG